QPLIMDVEQSSLNHADGLFHYADDAAESDFVGAARTMPNRFTTWLNPWLETEVKWLHIATNNMCIIDLRDSARAYLTEGEEMVLVKLHSNSNFYKVLHKEANCKDYRSGQYLSNTTAYTFRLCQINTTKEK
ncbi:MAG: hypothetical protein Q9N02_08115, partial [Ghiorsea sp.]|nr:hypothetical protein [Ghiorsea sp.]